jgi:cell division septation protein DedD
MFKKITYIIILTFFVTSCGDTASSIKRGLTGAKKTSGDEFLIKKKDPLILPPDYENLPIPNEETVTEEISTFEKNLGTLIEDNSSRSSSVEDSILKKIRSK